MDAVLLALLTTIPSPCWWSNLGRAVELTQWILSLLPTPLDPAWGRNQQITLLFIGGICPHGWTITWKSELSAVPIHLSLANRWSLSIDHSPLPIRLTAVSAVWFPAVGTYFFKPVAFCKHIISMLHLLQISCSLWINWPLTLLPPALFKILSKPVPRDLGFTLHPLKKQTFFL